MSVYPEKEKYKSEDLIRIVSILRDPVSGCPWDKIQTHQSIRKNFLEETYEVLEAIDAESPSMLREELGDVMMQVALHSCMEAEKGNFTFDDVCDVVCRKLIFRHPHIFCSEGTAQGEAPDWEALKNAEKGRRGLEDELATVPVTLPALMKAQKVQKRAEKYKAVGSDADAAYRETEQAEEALHSAMCTPPKTETNDDVVNRAAGKYLFAVCNWLRCAGVDAEEALEKEISDYVAAHGGEKNTVLRQSACTDKKCGGSEL